MIQRENDDRYHLFCDICWQYIPVGGTYYDVYVEYDSHKRHLSDFVDEPDDPIEDWNGEVCSLACHHAQQRDWMDGVDHAVHYHVHYIVWSGKKEDLLYGQKHRQSHFSG